MNQTSSQVIEPVSANARLTAVDVLAFFVIAVFITVVGQYIARSMFPGSHPRVRRAVVQTALLAGMALGAYVGMHFIDSQKSTELVQLSAHKAQ